MKRSTLLLIFFALALSCKAQLKIDPNYAFMVNDTAYENGSNIIYVFGPGNIGIKELASGKTCAIVSAEWIFSIRGSIYRDTRAEDIKIHMGMCKPKDILFLDRIKFASGCFVYPGQIAFVVQ